MTCRAALALLALLPAATLAQPAVSAPAAPEPASPQSTPDPCARWVAPGLEEGPVALGFFEADVATGRRVCPRSEAGIGGRLGLTVDTPNFYGAIAGDGLVFASLAADDRTELFATFEAVHHQWVQNAVLKGSTTSLGQLTAGASHQTFESGHWLGATSARFMLPTSTATPRVAVVGLELGQAVSYRRYDTVELHGYLGADVSAGLSAAASDVRAGLLLNVGAQWSPASSFGLVVDLNDHVGGTATYLAPALGLRFRPWRDVGAELDVTLPLAGTDRHDVVAGLRVGTRL